MDKAGSVRPGLGLWRAGEFRNAGRQIAQVVAELIERKTGRENLAYGLAGQIARQAIAADQAGIFAT